MTRSFEMRTERHYGKRATAGLAAMAFVLTGCERNISGIPVAVSAVEEAALSGSAIPLPEGLDCPGGGLPVVRASGEIAVAQSFIADEYKRDAEPRRYLAANYPELCYEAQNGTIVYCGEANRQNGVEHYGKMVIPNSCVDTGAGTEEVGAIVIGVDPLPAQPWWDETEGLFIGCPDAA